MENKRELGKTKENLVCSFLEEKGYVILEKNYRVRQAEIDIVAKDNDFLVFIEVKYRNNLKAGHPLEAVNAAKQRQISKAAIFYLNEHHINPYTANIRFDVVGVLNEEVLHVINAFSYIK